jgi:UDP-N-acetylmuramate--alanine ligase
MFENINSKHFLIIGAGGAGVSNIAQILLQAGAKVTGVDKLKNAATENLEKLGIKVYNEDEVKLDHITHVFRSAAIKDNHPLVILAKGKGLEVLSRFELFEQLSISKSVIAIAGSSGKTSTTGLISHILSADRDCGYLVGIHGNGGHYGAGNDFVLEADEYAKTFLHLKSIKLGIITGLKYDHVDIYPTKKEYDDAFVLFASRAKKLLINGDDSYLVDMMSKFKPITYGKNTNNNWSARNIYNFEGGSTFDVFNESQFVANIKLNVIGGHNIMNALAAFVANCISDVEVDTIVKALSQFNGLPRRVELLRSEPFYVYDDYAHLPGEIETVLKGLRESFPTRRILCFFQGHTYTRINAFFDDYSRALANCDFLFLADVYAARDSEGNVDLELLLSQVNIEHKVLSGNLESSKQLIIDNIKERDVIIFLNAGDGTKLAHFFAAYKF